MCGLSSTTSAFLLVPVCSTTANPYCIVSRYHRSPDVFVLLRSDFFLYSLNVCLRSEQQVVSGK